MFLVIGSTTLDLIHSGFEQLPTAQGDEFTVDSLVFCTDPVRMRFGGNGANSAYVLAKLGATAALGSAVGCDPAGDLLLRPLTEIGVDTQGLVRHPIAATSVTTVLTDANQQRLAFHHAGSSHTYTLSDLPEALRHQASALLIASFTLFVQWRPHGFAALLRQVKERGGITVLDIGPAIGTPVQLDEIAFLLPDVDYFICNAHELAVCTQVAQTAETVPLGMAQILAAGAGCVVVKRGAEGAWVQRNEDGAPVAVPGFPARVANTVGAGDSFNAGFLYAIQQQQAAQQSPDAVVAARFANAVAALVLTSEQGVLSAPTVQAVETFLSQAVP